MSEQATVCELTGVSPADAAILLASSNNSVEAAVALHFDGPPVAAAAAAAGAAAAAPGGGGGGGAIWEWEEGSEWNTFHSDQSDLLERGWRHGTFDSAGGRVQLSIHGGLYDVRRSGSMMPDFFGQFVQTNRITGFQRCVRRRSDDDGDDDADGAMVDADEEEEDVEDEEVEEEEEDSDDDDDDNAVDHPSWVPETPSANNKKRKNQTDDENKESTTTDDEHEDEDDAAAPDHLLCPISRRLLRDPVCTCDGQTYDRDNIVRWLRRSSRNGGSASSPLTGAALDNVSLIPNVLARQAVESFREQRRRRREGGEKEKMKGDREKDQEVEKKEETTGKEEQAAASVPEADKKQDDDGVVEVSPPPPKRPKTSDENPGAEKTSSSSSVGTKNNPEDEDKEEDEEMDEEMDLLASPPAPVSKKSSSSSQKSVSLSKDENPSSAAPTSSTSSPPASPPAKAHISLVLTEAEALNAGDLPDGGECHIQGSSSTPYKVTRRGTVYACTCMSWRMQSRSVMRTCKHIKMIRGEDAERERLRSSPGAFEGRRGGGSASSAGGGAGNGNGTGRGGSSNNNNSNNSNNNGIESGVALASQKWDETSWNSQLGWLLSEKLDGMRAVWDGYKLWTRKGNPIYPPETFVSALPRGVKLDGELFLGRGRFNDVMSVCRTDIPDEERWKDVRYMVFDAPDSSGGLTERLDAARMALSSTPSNIASVLDHEPCIDVEQVKRELDRIISLDPPGEGLILARSNVPHRGGRSSNLIKVKVFQTDDALIIGHKMASNGQFAGQLGALQCVKRDGVRFDVGTGLKHAQRAAPPSVGTVIEYRFFEITPAGVPRFPAFVKVRPDVDGGEFPQSL